MQLLKTSEAAGKAPLWVCYCDYDGCLHDDAVYSHPDRGIYLTTPGRNLFEWTPILENLLAPFPEVKLVLSTSWVRMRDFQFAKRKLPIKLQARVIGATFHNRLMRKDEFDLTSRGQQVLADVERRRPDKWFAIDNDDLGWPEWCRKHLIKTSDRQGISCRYVQQEIRSVLESFRNSA